MVGERLVRAKAIAMRRAKRRAIADIPTGRYRKWNQTCACHICKNNKAWHGRSHLERKLCKRNPNAIEVVA